MDWIKTADEHPPENKIVLVDGGTAVFKEMVWFSGMEHPYFQRPITWTVTHWAYCPCSATIAAAYITCPFCSKGYFDKIGLKDHLNGYCEKFYSTPVIARV